MCRQYRFLFFAIAFLSLGFQSSLLLAFPTIILTSCTPLCRRGTEIKQSLRKDDSFRTEGDIQADDVDLMNRRDAARRIISTIMIPMTIVPLWAQSADAGIPEIDAKSGLLFFPKEKMLGGGGSDLTRGFKLESREGTMSTKLFMGGTKANGLLQTVYDTRFITYLARFLLNFDEGGKSWWNEQNLGDDNYRDGFQSKKQLKFGEFAESVEIGLVDYFLGPYGNYDQAGKKILCKVFVMNVPVIFIFPFRFDLGDSKNRVVNIKSIQGGIRIFSHKRHCRWFQIAVFRLDRCESIHNTKEKS